MPELRPYQAELVRRAAEVFRRGPVVPGVKYSANARQTGRVRRVLLVLPTGGGKTVLFSSMAAGVEKQCRRARVVVHRDFLTQQVNAALIDAGCVDARAQMVASSAKETRPVSLLIFDEAHHAVASTWRKAIEAAEQAAERAGVVLWIVGVTATPERQDGVGLGDIFDALIEGPTTDDLVRIGYLCRPVLYSPPAQIDRKDLPKRGGDFTVEESAKRVAAIVGDVVGHYRKIANGTRAVAFCATVDSAETVARQFSGAGFPAECLHGKLDQVERDGMIARFRAGKTLILTSCEIISEGFDLPAIETAILLRPTDSLALYLQQVGRALRLFPGKNRAIILDHVGNVMEHGGPLMLREWSLDSQKRTRTARESGKISLWTCPVCFAINERVAVNKCSVCDHALQSKAVREIKRTSGELIETDGVKVSRAEPKMTSEELKALRKRCPQINQFVAELVKRGYPQRSAWGMAKPRYRWASDAK